MELVAEIVLVLYCLTAFGLAVYGVNCYVMIGLFWRRRRQRQSEEAALLQRFAATVREEDLPFVTTQLPVFNERNVVERIVRAVCAFDWPSGKHEIQILDDSTDETTAILVDLVQRLRAEGHDVWHVRRTHRRGFKAGALEEGLRTARGELVAIFDADFVPPPDFLRRTVPFLAMDPRCAFVQTRWGHLNRDASLLARAQAVGIDGHFVVEQAARAWNGLFLNFNGTAGVWRRAAIEDAGGWQPDTLTEDLDLSYRAQLAGWHPRFLFDVVTPAEIPTDINAFKSQQRRWAKGSIQVAIKLLPSVLRRSDVGWFAKVQATLHLTHYLVHPLIVAMTVLVLPLLLWGEPLFSTWVMIPLAAMMGAALFAPSTQYLFSQRMAYGRALPALRIVPALMALGVGLAVNNTRAVFEALVGRETAFVRTPKLGDAAENPRAPRGSKGYSLPLSRVVVFELLLGLWGIAAFVTYLRLTRFLVGPILLVHAVGFTWVGVLSLVHAWRVRSRAPDAPAGSRCGVATPRR